ncbi:Aminoglycoside phosphotransferase [Penicillium expansum]|nr:Aminoglycoside phosphotransferase [Penicillium expansum]
MSAFKSYDDYAWAISSQIWKDWPKLLRTDEDIKNNIQVILSEEFRDIECLRFHFLHTGGFNTCFKMDFTNHCGAIIWFPLPGAIIFPKRKEVWVIFLRHRAAKQDNLHPVPDPNIESVRLETLYKKLANILLSLSTLSLSRIGSIDKNTFSTRHEDICEVWRSRLHLLEPREVKPIEEYVELKLEEKKEEKKKKRNLTWDVDEYTKEWMERMIKKRKKEMEREETFA